MDIANRMGVNAQGRGPKGTRFVVTIAGLTDNPTYGTCATRGLPLTAQAAEFSGPVPAELFYQWYSTPGGAIAGATQAVFTPDDQLADESEIYCVVTVPDGSLSSAGAILREVAPQTQGSLFDEVFDLDTGSHVVATAAAFVGESLRFAVSGAGASVDEITGEVSVPTDTEVDGAVVTVTAFNSGGSAALAFQVTVEDLVSVEGVLPFGALTPAGVGGVPVAGSAITAGDPGGHWEITGGMLVPTAAGAGALAGIYPLAFDNGATLDVMIETDKASARVDEIASVFAGLPETARGLLVQDGDARGAGRIRLEPKVFLSEMVMEPTNWLEDADPRQSVRPVILGGLTIGGDPSDAEILRMENLTVQGFVCQLELGPSESESNNGIILVERPSRHVTIRQNEVWSRTTSDIVANDDYRNNYLTIGQMRGIATKAYAGNNEHIRVEDNYIHDVSRGVIMTATNQYEGVRSRLCGNLIEDCYTNFFTAGYLDGLDIFDNRCMGVYAADENTDGYVGSSNDGPHSAAGGSFDAGGSRTTQNITMMGNFFHVGWKRTKLARDLGLPDPKIGATGVKFNDPQAADSYWNLVVAFNVVVAHGLCLEISGASAQTHLDVFNNTLASESYIDGGSIPILSFGGASNVRMWNNIACSYYLNTTDDQGVYPATLDTLEGYGNLKINSGSADFGEIDYFTGDVIKVLNFLTLDEAAAAYVPKNTTRAMMATQKKGALGTGLYAGNGVHSVVYDKPVAIGGTPGSYPLTVWDGAAYLSHPDRLINRGSGQGLTFAIQAESDVVMDGLNALLFSLAGQRLYISKSGGGNISMKVEDNNETFMAGYPHGSALASGSGLVNLAFSADFEQGVLMFALNGVLSDWYVMTSLARRTLDLGAANPRIFANEGTIPADIWAGKLGLFYLNDDFIDLETSAGLSSLFAQNGQFRDFGPDGSGPTGTPPLVFVKGTAAQINPTINLGRGGAFQLVGSITDDVPSDQVPPSVTGVVPTAGEADVSINIKPAIIFSEAVGFGTGLITLYDVTNDTVLETFDVALDVGTGAGQVEVSGSVVTVYPTVPLGNDTTYAVQIAATAVEDLAGNAFAGVTDTATISFATVAGTAGFNPTTVSLVSYSGSATEVVTIPGNIQPGDIILLEGLGIESSSTGTFGSRAGFISVGQVGAGGQRKAHFMAKIANGTEQGTVTPVGDSDNGTGGGAIVLRLDIPPTSLSFLNADIGVGLGSPNPKSVPVSSYDAPVLVVAFYHVLDKTSDISARNFTGMTEDFEQRLLVDGTDDLWCKVRLLKAGDTFADIVASTDSDHGSFNMVGITAIQLG